MSEPLAVELRGKLEAFVAEHADASAEDQATFCKRIAETYGPVEGEWIKELFARARQTSPIDKLKAAAMARQRGEALPDNVVRMPSPAPSPQPSPAELFNGPAAPAAYIRRRPSLGAPKPAPTLAEPEPQPQAEPEPAPPPPKPEPPPLVLVLNPSAPYDSAREFIRRHYVIGERASLHYWQKVFYHWNGTFYEEVEPEILEGQVRDFLWAAKRYASRGQTEPFNPMQSHVNEVIHALESGVVLPARCTSPMWLDTRKPARGMVAFANGVVNIHTGEAAGHTERLWIHSAREFDWDPAQSAPIWEATLESYWPGDSEAKDFVEEWLGYCMTQETHLQKSAMFIGPRRSGKSTIAYVLRKLVGEKSFVGLSFDSWVRGENSQAVMVGKQVGVFSDVRLKQGKAYGTVGYDVGGLSHQSQALLLQIIGEDTITIGRKFIGAWEGQLPIKFVLISNEVPNLNDASGALSGRFIKLRFERSFYGHEDINLRDKLDAELSGIAARCVAAYVRLCRRGKFIQPASASALEADVQAASDPWLAMAMECFELGGEFTAIKTSAHMVFDTWCRDNNRFDMRCALNRFGNRLRQVPGFELICDAPRGHGAQREWLGFRLRLRPKAQPTMADLMKRVL
jgi:putative DNA primase/helicase